MSKRIKMWAYTAALFGGALLSWGGCGSFAINKQVGTILAILQEDLFG